MSWGMLLSLPSRCPTLSKHKVQTQEAQRGPASFQQALRSTGKILMAAQVASLPFVWGEGAVELPMQEVNGPAGGFQSHLWNASSM